jgi:hypothetical protein
MEVRIVSASKVSFVSSSAHLYGVKLDQVTLEISFNLPNLNNFLHILCSVFLCCDDEYAIKQVDRQAMRRLVFCSSYSCRPAVGRHDYKWGELLFESTVQKRKALYIEHVYFVNEEDLKKDV